jgi:hypothetical protein
MEGDLTILEKKISENIFVEKKNTQLGGFGWGGAQAGLKKSKGMSLSLKTEGAVSLNQQR